MPMVVDRCESGVHNHEFGRVTEQFPADFGEYVQSAFHSFARDFMLVALVNDHETLFVPFQLLSSQYKERIIFEVHFFLFQIQFAQGAIQAFQLWSRLQLVLSSKIKSLCEKPGQKIRKKRENPKRRKNGYSYFGVTSSASIMEATGKLILFIASRTASLLSPSTMNTALPSGPQQ
jgi:hypothetical protein